MPFQKAGYLPCQKFSLFRTLGRIFDTENNHLPEIGIIDYNK